jgi:hypothetical protein
LTTIAKDLNRWKSGGTPELISSRLSTILGIK